MNSLSIFSQFRCSDRGAGPVVELIFTEPFRNSTSFALAHALHSIEPE